MTSRSQFHRSGKSVVGIFGSFLLSHLSWQIASSQGSGGQESKYRQDCISTTVVSEGAVVGLLAVKDKVVVERHEKHDELRVLGGREVSIRERLRLLSFPINSLPQVSE